MCVRVRVVCFNCKLQLKIPVHLFSVTSILFNHVCVFLCVVCDVCVLIVSCNLKCMQLKKKHTHTYMYNTHTHTHAWLKEMHLTEISSAGILKLQLTCTINTHTHGFKKCIQLKKVVQEF